MTQIQLSTLTTAAVGGPAGTYSEARSEAEIIDAVRAADAAGQPLLIIGGGSNLLVSDDGFPGTVLKIASEGLAVNAEDSCGGVSVVVQAGHNWDAFVDHAVRHAWSGVEALSGIPGATGATPVQNVGAYGADVSQTIAAVRTWDRERNAVKTFTNSELKFGYRDSVLKQTTVNGSPRYVVLTVEFQLPLGRMSAPVRYAELARALGVEQGQRAYSNDVRREVLRLRASKGMVWDANDRDTYSTGSFFTNPIVPGEVAAAAAAGGPAVPGRRRRADQAFGGLADRPGRVRQGVRAGPGQRLGRPGVAVDQAHARHHQPRRGEHGGHAGCGARGAPRRRGTLRD